MLVCESPSGACGRSEWVQRRAKYFLFFISNIKILLKNNTAQVHRKCTIGATTSRNQITMIKQNRKEKSSQVLWYDPQKHKAPRTKSRQWDIATQQVSSWELGTWWTISQNQSINLSEVWERPINKYYTLLELKQASNARLSDTILPNFPSTSWDLD